MDRDTKTTNSHEPLSRRDRRIRKTGDLETWSLNNATAEDMELLMLPKDHEGHASSVLRRHPDRIAYTTARGWLYYTGTHWEAEGAEEDENLEKSCRANNGVVEGVKARLRDKPEVFHRIEDFDNNPDLLNARNGVINLRNGNLIEHQPSQRFTYCLSFDYDLDAHSQQWEDFVLEAVGNQEEIVEFLQMGVGYSATGHTSEEILFYLHGVTRSGKGTFTESILSVLGVPLSTEVDFTTFTAPRLGDTQNFDLAPLKPCRFVAASESNKQNPLNPSKIKSLTGGNLVRCAFKHRDHFQYRPQFVIWLSSNHPVNIDVDDDAAWSRIQVVNFPNSHLGKENKKLKRALLQPETSQAILSWLVKGAMKWYASEDGLVYPDAVRVATQAQRDEQDFVLEYLREDYDDDQEGWEAVGTMHTRYSNWCQLMGVPPKYLNKFSQAVKAKGYESDRKWIKTSETKGVHVRGFKGLRYRGNHNTE